MNQQRQQQRRQRRQQHDGNDDEDAGDEDRLAREPQSVAVPAQRRRKPGGQQRQECQAMRCSAVPGFDDGTTVAVAVMGMGRGRGRTKGSERGSMTLVGSGGGVTEEEVGTVRRRQMMECAGAHGFAAAAVHRLGVLLSAG